MKLKLSLFTLILSVFFISCKKNSNDTPTIDDLALLKQKVLGNWITTGAIIEYYDASEKLANTVDQSGTSEQTWEYFDNNSVNSYDNRGKRTYTYSFSKLNNVNYISITNNPTETYNINIENNKMTWSVEGPYKNDPAYATAKQIFYFSRK
ncbi:hypothetical protein [Pedobacter agri]|uniref:hypothetical protein n=1 Tax=Pedobacter agri TaxID=454586 RepID=UPI002930894F|nr:hypothetical protein [Pedobacter agri]